MNSTEAMARKWLAKGANIAEEEIVFSSNSTPDFILPDGSEYEVKRLYRDKIILYPSQVNILREREEINVIVFGKDGEEPTAIIPAREIVQALDNGTRTVLNIKLVVTEDKFQIYLGEELQERFQQYLDSEFTEADRVYSMVFRKAMNEFLKERGY